MTARSPCLKPYIPVMWQAGLMSPSHRALDDDQWAEDTKQHESYWELGRSINNA